MSIDNLKLPKGRIVSGNPGKFEQATDFHTKAKKLDKNGQPLMQNWCHIAIPKQDFLQQVWPQMIQEAMRVNPNAGNMHPDQYLSDRFAWKIIDGDSMMCAEGSKIPYRDREGYPGCYVIKLSTHAFSPPIYVFQNGAYREIAKNQIKCGDYVVCGVKLEGHTDKNGGLYWNPNIYELVEIGQSISGGETDPNAALGDAATRTHQGFQGQLPTAGAAGAPVPQAPMAPATPQAYTPAAPVMQQPYMPQAPMAPAAPVQMPPPARDFVQNAGMPQAPVNTAGYAPPVYAGGPAAPQPFAAPAVTPLPIAPQQGYGAATPAYPTNPAIPGMPQR